MDTIKLYDEARLKRDELIDYYGGISQFAQRLGVRQEAVRMWKSRSIAIPEGQAYKIVSWGDFSIDDIRPDL
jgi:DNA-binding transcriptional regulator YdaS (Cro superfamily)